MELPEKTVRLTYFAMTQPSRPPFGAMRSATVSLRERALAGAVYAVVTVIS